METPYEGGCLCGTVRYTCAAPPDVMYYCHCTDCRKANGSAYHAGLYMPRTTFTLTSGTPKRHTVTAESGRPLVRHFCGDCGSQIYSDNGDDTDMVSIKAGTLDDCSQFSPDTEIWVGSKVEWANLPADLKSYRRSFRDG